MMIRLKRFLTSLLKNNDNILRYIAFGSVLIAAVIIVRCETQKKIEAEVKFQRAEEEIEKKNAEKKRLDFMYDSILRVNENLKVRIDGVKVENNILRDSLSIIRPAIDKLSSSELKKLFARYKERHHLSNGR